MASIGDGLAFGGLINLADEGAGARALATSDDFFAGMENLLRAGRGEFDPTAYTDRGKLMDGWESRRKRTSGHDWCLVRLATPGVVRALDIDTNHFLGNHPPYASVEATSVEPGASLEALGRADWTTILPESPLRAGAQNLFVVTQEPDWPPAWSHLRLNIFPDGGVARLRAFGDVDRASAPNPVDDATGPLLERGEVELAGALRGGLAVACSDMFFGTMNNLILPGRAHDMGGGWETRRRRGPGHDWIVVRLGEPGSIGLVEVDTNHFKGNFPAHCSIDGVWAPNARLTALVDPTKQWSEVVPSVELTGHHRHFFRREISEPGPFSHVRLNIFPDGGVSRLRIWGRGGQDEGP